MANNNNNNNNKDLNDDMEKFSKRTAIMLVNLKSRLNIQPVYPVRKYCVHGAFVKSLKS